MLPRLFCLFCLLVPCSLDAASADPASELPQGLRDAARRSASQKGVDRQDNLWSFNDRSGSLTVVSPSGEILHQARHDAHSTVDFDAERGTLVLDRLGSTLSWLPPGQHEARKILELPHRAMEVCWLSADRFAIAPTHTAHQIEIWDLGTGRQVLRFGAGTEPRSGPGHIRLRHLLLRFDTANQLLWTLETFEGQVGAWTLDGERIFSWQTRHPELDSMETWIQSTDTEHRERGERVEATYDVWPALAVDEGGGAWVQQGCEGESVRWIYLSPEGARPRLEPGSCCGRQFTRWRDWMIVYPHPASTRACRDLRRLEP